MSDRLLDALDTARPAGVGVRDWSIYRTESQHLSLGVKDRETGNAHAPLSLSESCGAGYRLVWDDGLVSRGHLERRQLEEEAEQALAWARAAAYDDPDAAVVSGPAQMPDVPLYDAGASAIAGGETSTLGRRLETIRERIEAAGCSTWSGSFSASRAEAHLLTSAGLDARGSGTSFGWFVILDGEVGDGFQGRRPDDDAEFTARLDRLIGVSLELRREAKPLTPGLHPVLLAPRVVASFVLETLLHNLDGATVDSGEGHFPRERFGSDVAALRPDIRLAIDPLQPYRSGAYRFSGEGVPAAPSTFIDRGRLVQPVLDLKYARRLGLSPTALPHDSDVVEFSGASTLALEAGMAKGAGGVLVLSVLGVHTQDKASGDFSLSAPQALRLGGDGLEGRQRGTISGNLFEILRSERLRFVAFPGETVPGLLVHCRFDPQ